MSIYSEGTRIEKEKMLVSWMPSEERIWRTRPPNDTSKEYGKRSVYLLVVSEGFPWKGKRDIKM